MSNEYEKVCAVYEIVNTANDRRYVGFSTDYHQRVYSHLVGLKTQSHPNRYLQYDFNKFGEPSFTVQAVFVGSESQCKDKEMEIIRNTKPYYNVFVRSEFGQYYRTKTHEVGEKAERKKDDEIRYLKSRISELERSRVGSEYVPERVAAEILGIKVRTIREYRYKGILKRWRVRPSGKGFQYSVKELEKLIAA